MKTNSVDGNDQNMIKFGNLITYVSTLGNSYNPSVESLSIAGLNLLKQQGQTSIDFVNSYEINYKNAIAARITTFDGFDSQVTRAINALRISGVSEPTLEQAEAIVRELRAKRASDKLSADEIAAAKEKGSEIKQNTLHNATFDRKIENFSKLVLFLSAIPLYKPNEPDLSVEGLNARLTDMRTKNTDKTLADANLGAARRNRDVILYAKKTGLIDTALKAKLYVKSVFGAGSKEYKQISDISFSRPR